MMAVTIQKVSRPIGLTGASSISDKTGLNSCASSISKIFLLHSRICL